jgi:hypothetical protein
LLTHPTLDLLRQLGLNGMAKAFGEIEASGEAAALTHPEWLALLLDQEASYRRDRRLHIACDMPGCAIKLRSKMSTTAPPAGSTGPCSKSSPRAAGSTHMRT